MQNVFPSPQEFFAPQQEFVTPDPEPEPEQSPKIFYCAFSARAFMVLLMLLIVGASLTYVVFAQTSLYTSNGRWASAMAWLFVLLFLRLTEGRWFMFTCDRFARIANNELVLFGAFGRKRLRCQLDEALFYCTMDQEGNYRSLLVEDADARMRRFSLRLCEEPARLAEALQALDRQAYEAHLAEQELAQLGDEQHIWHNTYMQLLMTPIGFISAYQLVIRPFWSMQLLPEAWQGGLAFAALAVLPLCFWWRHTFRHIRFFNLPAHHHWRRNPLGHALAEILFYLRFSALILAVGCLYSLFFTYNAAWLSLKLQKRHAVQAHVSTTQQRCSKGKHGTIRYWKLHVQVPAPHSHFSGDWCSYVSAQSAPPEAGHYTVYLRESEYARELTFEP